MIKDILEGFFYIICFIANIVWEFIKMAWNYITGLLGF